MGTVAEGRRLHERTLRVQDAAGVVLVQAGQAEEADGAQAALVGARQAIGGVCAVAASAGGAVSAAADGAVPAEDAADAAILGRHAHEHLSQRQRRAVGVQDELLDAGHAGHEDIRAQRVVSRLRQHRARREVRQRHVHAQHAVHRRAGRVLLVGVDVDEERLEHLGGLEVVGPGRHREVEGHVAAVGVVVGRAGVVADDGHQALAGHAQVLIRRAAAGQLCVVDAEGAEAALRLGIRVHREARSGAGREAPARDLHARVHADLREAHGWAEALEVHHGHILALVAQAAVAAQEEGRRRLRRRLLRRRARAEHRDDDEKRIEHAGRRIRTGARVA
mmetsp:Transcript_2069/g.9098  ORF Transcript_2069/g.9098 Transcript_2069/m.9098 type:complete len:335 (+) Transcript_2069:276-1280(+)